MVARLEVMINVSRWLFHDVLGFQFYEQAWSHLQLAGAMDP